MHTAHCTKYRSSMGVWWLKGNKWTSIKAINQEKWFCRWAGGRSMVTRLRPRGRIVETQGHRYLILDRQMQRNVMHSNEFCCENKTFVQWFVCFSLNRILPELQISKSFQCKQTLDIGHCYLNISIFFEIYRKKHFIISPEHCNTAKHLNNDLSHLTSDYVSDKFSGNMEDALDILILLLISCIIAKLEMIKWIKHLATVLHII